MRIRSFQMRHAGRRSTFHSVGLFAVFLLIFPPESLAAEWLSVEAAQGYRLELLGQRGSWAQVRTASGHTGWIDSNDVERFDRL